MLGTLGSMLIEAALGAGARAILLGMGCSVLEAAIPSAVRYLYGAVSGATAVAPAPRCSGVTYQHPGPQGPRDRSGPVSRRARTTAARAPAGGSARPVGRTPTTVAPQRSRLRNRPR